MKTRTMLCCMRPLCFGTPASKHPAPLACRPGANRRACRRDTRHVLPQPGQSGGGHQMFQEPHGSSRSSAPSLRLRSAGVCRPASEVTRPVRIKLFPTGPAASCGDTSAAACTRCLPAACFPLFPLCTAARRKPARPAAVARKPGRAWVALRRCPAPH